MIRSLDLYNFRNHKSFSLNDLGNVVFIAGNNGIGKTNVIESISFLSPGRGFRGANLSDVLPMNDNSACEWSVRVKTDDDILATGFHNQKPRSRILKVNNEEIKKKSSLLDILRVIWLLPQQNNIVMQGQSIRRKFFDRICFNFSPEHLDNILTYEKLMRERLKLLTEYRHDDIWLTKIESNIANTILEINKQRENTVENLNETIVNLGFAISLQYKDEHTKGGYEYVANTLKDARVVDAKIGRNSFAPHRSEIFIVNNKKNVEIANCSTGEQKIMLSQLMISQVNRLKSCYNGKIVLLLDDIFAHLDEKHSAELIGNISDLEIQCWVTSASSAFIKDFKGSVSVVDL